MSDFSHVARPYAKAVFDLAQEQSNMADWSAQLQLMAAIVDDTQMASLVNNPAISAEQLIELVLAVGGDGLSAEAQNLVKLMVRNERLSAARELSSQYQALRDEVEQVIEAQLITAAQIDSKQAAVIVDALSKRLGKTVKLNTEVDESLIGGAIIRAGDWVVDGSVKAQLGELVGALAR